MAPPLTGGPGTLERRLLLAAADGDLRLFKRIASTLDGRKGHIGEVMEAVRDYDPGALHVAAGHGSMAVCAYLLDELHVDVGAIDKSGETPLDYAVRGRDMKTVRFLLAHGADPNKPGEHGCTALHVAAGAGMCEMIEALLSKGADVDSFSYCGTPLHAAIIGKQDAAVKILLEHHANAGADVKGVGQLTPLVVTANEGLTDFYKCLLDAGADPDVRDDDDPLYKMGPAYLKSEGNKAYKRKDYVSTVNFYSMAMKLDPSDVTLHSNKSLCRINLGDGEKALLDAEFCRTMRPDRPKACYRQGAAHMLLKDYEKACDAFLDG